MVDFSLLQANPIPLPIGELQAVNESLKRQNKTLTIVLAGLVVCTAIFIVHKEIERKKAENERYLKSQLPRD
jgi:hypothetical protein